MAREKKVTDPIRDVMWSSRHGAGGAIGSFGRMLGYCMLALRGCVYLHFGIYLYIVL